MPNEKSKPTIPVSVVIPAYDAASTIGDALDSVLRQSTSAQEIIVVDDGSSDETASIARSKGAVVLHQPNAGPGSARNRGVREAKSEWVAFLDADDMWLADKLAVQWAALTVAPGAAFLASDFAVVRGEAVQKKSELSTHVSYARTHRTRIAANASALTCESLARWLPLGNFVLPSSILIKRALMSEHPFSESLPSTEDILVAEDFEWALRLAKSTPLVMVEEPLTTYRLSPGSLSANVCRVLHGDVVMAKRIIADGQQYHPSTPAAFRAFLPALERRAIRAYLRSGNFQGARSLLESADALPGVERLAYRVASSRLLSPGHWAYTNARRMKGLMRRKLSPSI